MNRRLKTHTSQCILLYRNGSIGDTIMALPCFHKIRECYPDAYIILLTNKPFTIKEAPLESILGKNYFFDLLLAYPGATRNVFAIFRLLLRLWLLQIDIVIDLTVSKVPNRVSRDLFFFKLAGIKQFIGFPVNGEHLNLEIDLTTGCVEWEAKRLAKRITDLGPIDLFRPHYWDLRLTTTEVAEADNLLKAFVNDPIIAISLGTKASSKDWGLDNWLALLKRLNLSLANWTLVIIGAPDEQPIAEQCMQVWQGASLSLCGRTTARVSAAVLKQATLFVGHDSGPMHLAGCVGTPCVAIFSARNLPNQWFPRGENNHILYHRTECAGCGLIDCIEHQKKCILSITVGEVEEAILNIAALA